jgi:CheY-like chemotaxis protein
MASDGAQAVDMVIEDPPDLILMDVHMPTVDGIEATRRIRAWEKESQRPSPIMIAAFTADVLPEDRTACLEAGMDEFLLKPLQSAKLVSVLEKAALSIRKDNNSTAGIPA